MITKTHCKTFILLIFIGISSIFPAGCASLRENDALFQAQAAYDKAASDPMVSANAPVALAEARDELTRAENSNSEDQMTHRSYMTLKKTEIAVATAQEKTAQEERQRLAREKDAMLLQQGKSKIDVSK